MLAGEREGAALAAGLDEVDQELLGLALGALAGDATVRDRLERLAREAQQEAEQIQQAEQAEQAQALMAAFQRWLATPAGQKLTSCSPGGFTTALTTPPTMMDANKDAKTTTAPHPRGVRR